MSAHCHSNSCSTEQASDPRYRRILWIALMLNLLMFIVELTAGLASGSVSLLADAIDFFGDAANYAVSLAVLSMALVVRAKAALFKAACMLAFGLFVLGKAAWSARTGVPPEALTMGIVGFAALCVNIGVAAMLYAYRNGDANMQSVWLCSRNDALSNMAVILAAFGVFGTASAWPDLVVASVMGLLAISSAFTVFKSARKELATGEKQAAHSH
ncbi:cation diffusion facilitator family transporter [Variovorax sp. PCZ-1]|uniref:cation transporter n=1 Tax=Variovorax sp. PCZ-1 TaxID=2835533 RepID=UPI001BCF9AD8|nr:cation diffusion facilitator family transporter [Variovorax sp. PCZ-1]MBS7807959.1 cation transporter [Variovorax sp. PCZ-1]